ncbi:MAG: hypothetical protein HIU85_20065 [Proteobacteria bacterium]|nr:hypothetical protein [Pseudomonadota bacterium]
MSAEDTLMLQDHLRPLLEICGGEVRFMIEGERRLIFLGKLHFQVNGTEKVMDAVLCLNHNNPTYPTKLYLAEKLGCGLNWNEAASLLGRNWFTFSWRDVPSNQSPIEILAAHLAPLARGRAA